MKCIYCNSNAANSDEHHFPACLGMDKIINYRMLKDKLCEECNIKIGKVEEQFCRCGPEAFFRVLLNIRGRAYHKKVNPFYRGSAGGHRITNITDHPTKDCTLYCELKPGEEDCHPARQIILKDKNGKYHSILITDCLQTPKDLEEVIKREGIKDPALDECWASEDEHEWIDRLTKLFKKRFEWDKESPSYVIGRKQFETRFRITSYYFRAIAKIAFHYFLLHFTQFSGNEDEFSGIKKFILEGGNVDDWVRQIKGTFLSDVVPGYAATDKYGHAIAVDKSRMVIFANIVFFFGPKGFPPFFYKTYIGKNPEKIIYPEHKGHQIVYFHEPDSNGFIGRMDPLKSIPQWLLIRDV